MKKLFNQIKKADQTKPKKKLTTTHKLSKKTSFAEKKSSIGPYLTATFTAILIGLFFGVIMLNMFTKKEENASTNEPQSVAAHEDTNDVNQTENKPVTLEQMNAFVLQLGVFSEIDNANVWSETYQQQGFPTVHFFRDDQYFLFVGLAETEEKAKEFATTLLENDIEVYVKEWATNEIEVELTEEESEWVILFQKQWQSTLASLGKPEEIVLDDWSELTENYPLESEKIAQLVEEIQSIIENEIEAENGFALQNALLNIWKTYEEIFINK